MPRSIAELRQRRADLVKEMRDIQNDAEAAGKYTEEQTEAFGALEGELSGLVNEAGTGLLDRAELVQERERQAAGREFDADHLRETHRRDEALRRENTEAVAASLVDTPRTFNSLGQQLQAIAAANAPHGHAAADLSGMPQDQARAMLQEFNAASPSGMSTGIPSEGGVLVQTDFSADIIRNAFEVARLAPRCFTVPIGPNSDGLEVPFIDEVSRKTGARWGGIQVYRRPEAGAVAASQPKLGMHETRLQDLMGIAYTTGRQLQDGVAMGAIMTQAFTEEFAFVIDDEIFDGNGAARGLGYMRSKALATVPKETSQTTPTIVSDNVTNMYASMLPRYLMNSRWYANIETLPQLVKMQVGDRPVFVPPGGFSEVPFGMLLGRPLEYIEHAEQLGTKGDLTLADLGRYLLIRKGGMQADTSMHVRFLYDEMAFRFMVRINGQPMLKKVIEPYKGQTSKSAFVALATRP